MALTHRYNATERTARKAAKAAARAAHGTGVAVPAIRDRLDKVEQAVGIFPA